MVSQLISKVDYTKCNPPSTEANKGRPSTKPPRKGEYMGCSRLNTHDDVPELIKVTMVQGFGVEVSKIAGSRAVQRVDKLTGNELPGLEHPNIHMLRAV